MIIKSNNFYFQSFLDEHGESNGDVNKNIIGQFGVGFYSTFMVGDKVEVYSQSYKEDEPAYKWVSDGYVCHTLILSVQRHNWQCPDIKNKEEMYFCIANILVSVQVCSTCQQFG